jgi:hypothetical protein
MKRRPIAATTKKVEPARKLTAKEAAPYFKIMQEKEPANQVCFYAFFF